MKKLILLLPFFLSFSAHAEVRLILSRAKSAPMAAAKMDELAKRPEVLRHSSVFSKVEAERLKKMGAAHLADSRLIFVKDKEAERALLKAVRVADAGLRLEPGELEMWIASEPLESEQWSLHNTQKRQSIELDFMNSYWVPSREGEDVGLDRAAPALAKLPLKRKVRVAVLDTGLDSEHPDLEGKLFRREPECRALEKFKACLSEKERPECEKIWMDLNNPEVDQDKNGYPLDCKGWTLLGGLNKAGIMGRPDYEDTEGHGSHVAGIIAAGAANGTGIRGCSDNVELIPVQVLGKNPGEPIKPLSTPPVDISPQEGRRKKPQELSDIVARGVIYAIHAGADVINFSMGWPQARDSEFMRDVIKEAQRRGILIVAAAGNDSTKALLMPCAYPGVLCVAAHGPDGALSHFSNYGSGVDVAAPGLNILSTWPMAKRPLRFRSQYGYEFLHGTSQASPLVACMAGELMSRGMNADESYSRIVLGSRAHRVPLELEQGSPHNLPENSRAVEKKEPYAKYTLSGNADLARALSVNPQALVVPAEKQKALIKWDLKASELKFPFQLKNLWRDANDIRLDVKLVGADNPRAIRPSLVSVQGSLASPWRASETREFIATLRIEDAEDPVNSRIPSDLELEVQVFLENRPQLKFRIPGEVIVELNATLQGVKNISIGTLPRVRYTLLPVDLNLDAHQDYHDYLLADYGDKEWTYYLLAQAKGQGSESRYEVRGSFKFPTPEKPDDIREQIVARGNFDKSGKTQYMLGLIQDMTDAEEPTPSPATFYLLDDKFALIQETKYDSKVAQLPYDTSGMQVQWMQMKDRKVPTWIGFGKDPYKKRSIRDLWEDPEEGESPDIRLYYLDEAAKLQAIKEHNEYRIVDLLRPTLSDIQAGRVPIILAKNKGTDLKISYMFDFARAELVNGKVENFRKLEFFENGIPYRNLLNTRVDSVLSLDANGADTYIGTFWFSGERPREQRVSILMSGSDSFADYRMSALRGTVDAALWVRAVYAGVNRMAAFALTNSEVQYHDFTTGAAALYSLDRYTFYQDVLTTNLQFPVVVQDRVSNTQLPGLYTTEGSRFNRGTKVTIPQYDREGKLVELTAPARFRLTTGIGCRPLDTPIRVNGKPHFDYFCGDRFLRVPLEY
jgi:hypothetical protein